MTSNLHASSAPDGTPPTQSNQPLEEQLARILTKVPPILRLPAPGTRCAYSQLSRTGLSELVTPTDRNGWKPPVQAIYQRAHRHAQRGIWLISAENLFRYLLSLGASSVEEYQKADSFRTPSGEGSRPQDEAPVSRNTHKKGKNLPSHLPTRTSEGLS